MHQTPVTIHPHYSRALPASKRNAPNRSRSIGWFLISRLG
jgi:hypothetical protein